MNPLTRSKQVPQNILNVEFKLFDFMTLKQFTVLCVSGGLGFLFFAVLSGPFKIIIPILTVILGLVVAFSKFNGEPFATYITYFILAVLSPQKRVWKKKGNASLDSVNDLGMLLPKTVPAKKTESLINPNDSMKPLTPTNSNIVHDTQPTTSRIVLPEITPKAEPEIEVKSNIEKQIVPEPIPSSLLSEGHKTVEPKIESTIESATTPVNPVTPTPVVTPIETQPIPSFIKTETPVSPLPKTQQFGEVADNSKKDFKVLIQDMSGSPLNSQVVLLETVNGVPVEAKVSINGEVIFSIPMEQHDYLISAASNQNLEFEKKKVSFSEIMSPNNIIVIRAIKSQTTPVEPVQIEAPLQQTPQPVQQNFESEHSVRALTSPVSNPDLHLPPESTQTKVSNISMETLPEAVEVDAIDKNIPNTINGVVKDNFGHYLQAVIVAIKNEEQMIVRALSTNQLGQFFSHSPIYAGKYTIEFEKDGYKFEMYDIEINNKVIEPRVFTGEKLQASNENSTLPKSSGII